MRLAAPCQHRGRERSRTSLPQASTAPPGGIRHGTACLFPIIVTRQGGLHLDRDGRDGIAHLKGTVDFRLEGANIIPT